jgi:hypothetical protein
VNIFTSINSINQSYLTMKYFTIFITLITIFAFSSCGSGNNEPESEAYFESNDQFEELQSSLNNQFSKDAGYQSIMLSFDERMGNTVLVKVSKNIEENNIEEWFYINEDWNKEAESKIKLNDKKVSDFLFSLKDDYDLSLLLSIVNKSKEKVINDFKVEKVICKSINLIMSKERTSTNKMDDLITQATVENQEDGTTYKINFDAKGNLKDISN